MDVSVVIPLRNEEKYIDKCIASLLAQDYPKQNVEFLLVDGRSEDATTTIIKTYTDKYPFIHLLDNPGRIAPTAMNIGIKAAKGEIIVRMDAHAEYATDYISKCVEWSQKTGAENVGGPMRAVGMGYIGKAIEFIHHSPFGLGGGKFHDENFSGHVDTVYLGAFKKEIFNKVGMYDERLVRNQDIELNSRIRAQGGTCFLTPEIRSLYYNRPTLKALWQQNYKNGLWNIYTFQVTGSALSLRHFVPLLFVVGLLSTALLAIMGQLLANNEILSMIGKGMFMLCAGSYLLTAIYFSLKISIQKGWQYFAILPVVFFVLHFSYGLGSLEGLTTVKKWVADNGVKRA